MTLLASAKGPNIEDGPHIVSLPSPKETGDDTYQQASPLFMTPHLAIDLPLACDSGSSPMSLRWKRSSLRMSRLERVYLGIYFADLTNSGIAMQPLCGRRTEVTFYRVVLNLRVGISDNSNMMASLTRNLCESSSWKITREYLFLLQ